MATTNINYADGGRSAFHRRIQTLTGGVNDGFALVDKRLDSGFATLTQQLDQGLRRVADAVAKSPQGTTLVVAILAARIDIVVDLGHWHWICIGGTDPVRDAHALMSERSVKSLLVVDAASQPQGLCTRSGIVQAAVQRKWTSPVQDFMVPQSALIGLPSDATVAQAVERFGQSGVRRLVLFGGDRQPRALLTLRTLLGWFAAQLQAASQRESG